MFFKVISLPCNLTKILFHKEVSEWNDVSKPKTTQGTMYISTLPKIMATTPMHKYLVSKEEISLKWKTIVEEETLELGLNEKFVEPFTTL